MEGREKLEKTTTEALHRTMVVLREEIERKNQLIRKLRKKTRNQAEHSQSKRIINGQWCVMTIEDYGLRY